MATDSMDGTYQTPQNLAIIAPAPEAAPFFSDSLISRSIAVSRRADASHIVACLLILTGTLTGCGAYSAYRKCGSGGCPGDAKITAEVRALLNQHPALAPPNYVYVQTLDGVVYLTGQVATDLQRDSAEAVAHEASGVSRVMNTIALTYAGR